MKRQGFSLIEVLVSMTLALVLLLGTAELITLSVWAKRRGDTTSGLAHSLTTRLEGLKSLSFESDGLRPGEYSEAVRDEAGRGLFLHEWTVEDAGERMKRVRVTVCPAGRPGSGASVTLWISKDLGFAP
ncbi:MAG: prepilin-type N-terminal cleavage/methylation domain-containing protein [Candidatus Aminicenantales bacterium]|jgi:prepilin-type N-terminal cleavage/methylation domain-containing protein